MHKLQLPHGYKGGATCVIVVGFVGVVGGGGGLGKANKNNMAIQLPHCTLCVNVCASCKILLYRVCDM